jgi:cytochrome P450 family 6
MSCPSLLTGSPVEVIETMARFSTDVVASCAFGINGNSLKDPDAAFRRRLRTIFDFTFRKGLTAMLQFFAPSVLSLIKLKFVDAATENFITETVWSTIEYRQG